METEEKEQVNIRNKQMEQSPQAPRDRRQGALLSLNNTPYNCESISALNVNEMLKTKYEPERFQQSATPPSTVGT